MKNHLRPHWNWRWNWVALFLSLTVVPVVACGQSHPAEPRSRPASPGGRGLRLSLGQALEIALQPEGNARIQIAEQLIRQAQARSVTRPIFCTNRSESLHRSLGAVKLVSVAGEGGYRVCVETRFSWLEIKRDHDPLQNFVVSIFAESPVRESAELAFLI